MATPTVLVGADASGCSIASRLIDELGRMDESLLSVTSFLDLSGEEREPGGGPRERAPDQLAFRSALDCSDYCMDAGGTGDPAELHGAFVGERGRTVLEHLDRHLAALQEAAASGPRPRLANHQNVVVLASVPRPPVPVYLDDVARLARAASPSFRQNVLLTAPLLGTSEDRGRLEDATFQLLAETLEAPRIEQPYGDDRGVYAAPEDVHGEGHRRSGFDRIVLMDDEVPSRGIRLTDDEIIEAAVTFLSSLQDLPPNGQPYRAVVGTSDISSPLGTFGVASWRMDGPRLARYCACRRLECLSAAQLQGAASALNSARRDGMEEQLQRDDQNADRQLRARVGEYFDDLQEETVVRRERLSDELGAVDQLDEWRHLTEQLDDLREAPLEDWASRLHELDRVIGNSIFRPFARWIRRRARELSDEFRQPLRRRLGEAFRQNRRGVAIAGLLLGDLRNFLRERTREMRLQLRGDGGKPDDSTEARLRSADEALEETLEEVERRAEALPRRSAVLLRALVLFLGVGLLGVPSLTAWSSLEGPAAWIASVVLGGVTGGGLYVAAYGWPLSRLWKLAREAGEHLRRKYSLVEQVDQIEAEQEYYDQVRLTVEAEVPDESSAPPADEAGKGDDRPLVGRLGREVRRIGRRASEVRAEIREELERDSSFARSAVASPEAYWATREEAAPDPEMTSELWETRREVEDDRYALPDDEERVEDLYGQRQVWSAVMEGDTDEAVSQMVTRLDQRYRQAFEATVGQRRSLTVFEMLTEHPASALTETGRPSEREKRALEWLDDAAEMLLDALHPEKQTPAFEILLTPAEVDHPRALVSPEVNQMTLLRFHEVECSEPRRFQQLFAAFRRERQSGRPPPATREARQDVGREFAKEYGWSS